MVMFDEKLVEIIVVLRVASRPKVQNPHFARHQSGTPCHAGLTGMMVYEFVTCRIKLIAFVICLWCRVHHLLN